MINIGTGIRTSLLDIIQELENLTGSRLEVRYLDARQGDIRHSQADITKLQALRGKKGGLSFAEGLHLLVGGMDCP